MSTHWPTGIYIYVYGRRAGNLELVFYLAKEKRKSMTIQRSAIMRLSQKVSHDSSQSVHVTG